MSNETTIEIESYEAGRRFVGRGKDRALAWFDSQSNAIGYPYMDSTTYAQSRAAFLRGAGHKKGR